VVQSVGMHACVRIKTWGRGRCRQDTLLEGEVGRHMYWVRREKERKRPSVCVWGEGVVRTEVDDTACHGSAKVNADVL